jgi:HD-like signal output (HDOD) protein
MSYWYGLAVLVSLGIVVGLWNVGRNKAQRSRQQQAVAQQKARRLTEARRALTANTTAESSTEPDNQEPPRPAPAHVGRSLLVESALDTSARQRLHEFRQVIPRPRSTLVQLLRGDNDPAELAELLSTDPGSAALVLRAVNSAQFNLTTKVNSVRHAITYLGANLVRDILLRNLISAEVRMTDSQLERIYQQLWQGGYLASGLASLMALQLRFDAPSHIATQALFFSLGDLSLLTAFPALKPLYADALSLPDRVFAVQDQLGFSPAVAGAALARDWELPDTLVDVLAQGLTPLTTPVDACAVGDLRAFTLSYVSHRLAETMIQAHLDDCGLAFARLREADEFFYLRDYLARAGLQNLGSILADPGLAQKTHALTVTLAALA